MSVILYKAGDTHEIDGVKCEMKVFDEYLFKTNLDLGWCFSPADCYKEKDADIRAIAKKKGIRSWHNKKIARLKKEIKE